MSTDNKVTEYITSITDWRGEMLQELRKIIDTTSTELHEDFKWSVPVWTSNGLVCAISAFKDHVKINFFKGMYLDDPKKLFNSGLDSKEHRSINFAKDDTLDQPAITKLVQEALKYNQK